MSKKKSSNIDETMMYYAQRKCETCQKLIVGRSPKSYQGANSDLGQRLKAHQEECQKDSKQLKLSLLGKEGKQTQPISRVTLRGDVK